MFECNFPRLAWLVRAFLLSLVVVGLPACTQPTAPGAPQLRLSLSAVPLLLPATGGQAVVRATLLTEGGSPIPGAQVTFAATAGTLSATNATTDAAGIAAVTLTSTVASTVTARARSGRIASFLEAPALQVGLTVDTALTVTVEPAELRRGDTATIRVSATSGGTPVGGTLIVDLGDGTVRDLGQVSGVTVLTHKYQREGRLQITASFTRNNRTQTNKVDIEVRGFAPGVDQIDASQITWLSPATTNISDWPVTSTITDYSISGSVVCLFHTKAGLWPLVSIDDNPPNIEANILIVANVDGRWYGGGFDWLGQGRVCKDVRKEEYGPEQIRVPPLGASWPGPQSGEEVGLLISTPSSNRIPVRSVNQRTNIIRVIWP